MSPGALLRRRRNRSPGDGVPERPSAAMSRLVWYRVLKCRGVAQPGSATALGAVGRGFKSLHPDQYFSDAAPVAQLDRVTGFEPVGREFESLRARHFPLARNT